MSPSENMSLVQLLVHWGVSALALLAVAYLVRGFKVRSFPAALGASVLIGLANAVIWPILIFLTLPINILTLGLFTFVVNGAVLKLCAALMPGFEIDGWLAAIFGSIVLSILGALLHAFLI
jgi:putative membrane protein